MAHPSKPKRKAKVTLPRGIRQLQSGRFIIDVTVNGNRKTATANTVDEAIETRAMMLAEAKGLSSLPAATASALAQNKPWTLQDAYDRTLANIWSGMSSEKTAKINSQTALDFFGPLTPISAIDVDALDRYVIHLMNKGASDATINRKMSVLSKIFRVARDRGQLKEIPKLPRRKEREGRIRFLTPAEEQQVLKWLLHLGKADHWDATVILIDTGFRTGELWRVAAEHVDLNRGCITLWRTKSGKPRTVPMTSRVKEIIIRRARQYPVGPLFPDGSKDWYRVGWDKVRQLMGKDEDSEFVPHALRHTCCSRLVQRGVPITHVQSWMGHKSIQTTMRYAHLMPHDLFTAAAVLEGGENARWDAFQNEDATIAIPRKHLLQ